MVLVHQTPNVNGFLPEFRASRSATLAWLTACLLSITALSLAAAHAPPRIRLVGLFSVAFGLFVGKLLVLLAAQFEAHPSRRAIVVLASILSFAGLIGSTWETARLEEVRRIQSGNEGVAARLIEEFVMRIDHADQDVSDSSAMAVFRRHLIRRIRQLGEWKSPWPEILWLAELIAAVAASGWMSSRSLWTDSRSSNQEEEAVR